MKKRRFGIGMQVYHPGFDLGFIFVASSFKQFFSMRKAAGRIMRGLDPRFPGNKWARFEFKRDFK